jgi:hypothetical protein
MQIPMDQLDADITSMTDVARLRALLAEMQADHERQMTGIDPVSRLPLDKDYMRLAEKLILQIARLEKNPPPH